MRASVIIGALATAFVTNAWTYPECDPTNCYNQLTDKTNGGGSPKFCFSFLGNITVDASSIPGAYNNCVGDVKAVSSACSCITYTATRTPGASSNTKTVPPVTITTSGKSPETTESCKSSLSTSESSKVSTLTTTASSTATATKVVMITSCAPTVTDCPYTTEPITTTTVSTHTTVCSVSSIEEAKPSTAVSKENLSAMTTSTISETKVITISSCKSEVTNCPYAIKPIVSTTVSVYTTVCPVNSQPTKPGSSIPLTTYTVSETKVITISRCKPEVTDCLYTTNPVVSTTVLVYTTVCPITSTASLVSSAASSTTMTSTRDTTQQTTISSCTGIGACPYTTKPLTTSTVMPITATLIVCPGGPSCPGASSVVTNVIPSGTNSPTSTTTNVLQVTGAAGRVTFKKFAAAAGIAAFFL